LKISISSKNLEGHGERLRQEELKFKDELHSETLSQNKTRLKTSN
jgi:hypothetical protein